MSDHTNKQTEQTQQTADDLHIPDQEVEALARAMATQKLAEKRADEYLKEARKSTEDLSDRIGKGLVRGFRKAANGLSEWQESREQERRRREEREAALEIAEERLVQEHMPEARALLEAKAKEKEEGRAEEA